MRLSVENGFHLPRDAARCAALIGVNDYSGADLSDFDKFDGKYRYVGTEKDLAKRLVGPVATFLRRPDVEVVLKAYSPLDDDEPLDEDYDDDPGREDCIQGVNELVDRMNVAASNWLRGAGETPHPLLVQGIDVALAGLITGAAGPDRAGPSFEELVDQFDDRQGILDAADQVMRFMQQFNSPAAMFESLGLPPPDIEEDDDRALPSDSHN
jgi:hypothetical protein